MKRPLVSLLFALLVLASHSLPSSAAAPVWPHDESDLKPDPAVTWGNLPNGLRYAVMGHEQPAEDGQVSPRVSLRLYVDAGSLMEEDDQQGLAHFLEHMALNGTRHYAAGQMQAYFQRLGMQFGADTNAHTSFNETVYQLELPENTDAYLNDALVLLRDYADGMLLADEEIRKERGVVLNELLYRDSTAYRVYVEGLKFMLPESRLVERFPIGKAEIIHQATRDRYVSFYQQWYTPDRMTVVVVGPVSPAEIIAKLQSTFGDMQPPAAPAGDPDLGQVTTGRGLQVKLVTATDAGQTQIKLSVVRPARRLPDTSKTQSEELPLLLANCMLNRRLAKLTIGQQPPFLAAEAAVEDLHELDFAEIESLTVACNPDDWQRALGSGEQELRRALSFGFEEEEFKQIKAIILSFLESAAGGAATRDASSLADNLVQRIAQGEVFTHPADDLTLGQAMLEAVTAEQCLDALRQAWSSDDVWVYVSGNLSLEDGQQKITDALLASTQVPVTPPATKAAADWAYTDFGPAGEVTGRKDVADPGLTMVTFGNHVRLNLKPTKFAQDSIQINVNFGAGRLTAPSDQPGLITFAGDNFVGGGLAQHGIAEIVDMVAGKKAAVRFSVRDEWFTLSGSTNGEDLEFQLQLLCAYLADAGYSSDAVASYGQNVETNYGQMEHDATGVLQLNVGKLFYQGDARFGFPAKGDLKARTMAELQNWLAGPAASSYLEIAVVGDFDPQAVIDGVAKTFGALPARSATRPDFTTHRLVRKATTARDEVVRFQSDITKSTVLVQWPTTDCRRSIALKRQCDILAAILGDRVLATVREELGETYSPYVGNDMSHTFTNHGALTCELSCEAQKAQQIAGVVRQLAAEMAEQGVTDDELARAKAPSLKQIEQGRRENWFWMAWIEDAQSNPQSLESVRTFAADYENVTVEDVNRLARIYLPQEQAVVVYSLPEAATPDLAAVEDQQTLLRPVSDVKVLSSQAATSPVAGGSVAAAPPESQQASIETKQIDPVTSQNAAPEIIAPEPAAQQPAPAESSPATTTRAIPVSDRQVATKPVAVQPGLLKTAAVPRRLAQPVLRQTAGSAPPVGETTVAQPGPSEEPTVAKDTTFAGPQRQLTNRQRPVPAKAPVTRGAAVPPPAMPGLLHRFVTVGHGHRPGPFQQSRRELTLHTDWSFRLTVVPPPGARNRPFAKSAAPPAIEGKWAVRDERLVLTFSDGFVDSGQITTDEPDLGLVFAGDRWQDVGVVK